MEYGFKSIKDVLEIVVVPLAIFLLGVFWPLIQAQYRCRRFRRLAHRELEEIGPRLDLPDQDKWNKHLTKEFVHKQIIESASENRDFILGLDPEFVYWLSQLWFAHRSGEADQWIHYAAALSKHRYTRSDKLTEAVRQWRKIVDKYEAKPTVKP